MSEFVQVIQADRDAAVALADILVPAMLAAGMDVACNQTDTGTVTQAFARHRLVVQDRPWIFPQSIHDMPVKPGVKDYEYVECLILRRGEILSRPWNCEHLCFDDEAHDDHAYDWDEIDAYQVLPEVEAVWAAKTLKAEAPTHG